jgi:hypothetical protein
MSNDEKCYEYNVPTLETCLKLKEIWKSKTTFCWVRGNSKYKLCVTLSKGKSYPTSKQEISIYNYCISGIADIQTFFESYLPNILPAPQIQDFLSRLPYELNGYSLMLIGDKLKYKELNTPNGNEVNVIKVINQNFTEAYAKMYLLLKEKGVNLKT